jgi:transposase
VAARLAPRRAAAGQSHQPDVQTVAQAEHRRRSRESRASWPIREAAVRASGTSLTQVFGVGLVIAGTIIGDVADVARFPGRDHFPSYNGTAPVEVSSGNRKTRRLSLRGNRRINHAIHMAAITQLRHKHSDGRAY